MQCLGRWPRLLHYAPSALRHSSLLGAHLAKRAAELRTPSLFSSRRNNPLLLCLLVWLLETSTRLLERIVAVWPSQYNAIFAHRFVSLACEIKRLPSPQMRSRDQPCLGTAHGCGSKKLSGRPLWLAQ